MESKHTTGPWFRGCHGAHEIQITKDDNGTDRERTDDISNTWVIAGVNTCMGHDEALANAKLIAAAPELLAIVRQFMASHDQMVNMNGYRESDGDDWAGLAFSRVMDTASKAIAKATE